MLTKLLTLLTIKIFCRCFIIEIRKDCVFLYEYHRFWPGKRVITTGMGPRYCWDEIYKRVHPEERIRVKVRDISV